MFDSLAHARRILAHWRHDYNHIRPHSSLGGLAPPARRSLELVGGAPLALALGLYTTQRRSDLVKLGRQHIKDGYFHLTQHKNRNIKPVRLQIWIHPELQRVIDETPSTGMTLLETHFGKSFSSNGFGRRFKKWCRDAGLPERCSVHGLRKAGATRLANSGASDHDIMAVTGHTTVKQLHGYTREADRKVGAERALKKL